MDSVDESLSQSAFMPGDNSGPWMIMSPDIAQPCQPPSLDETKTCVFFQLDMLRILIYNETFYLIPLENSSFAVILSQGS